MDFRHLRHGSRIIYQTSGTKEYGTITKTDDTTFTVRFDKIFVPHLQSDENGIRNSWRFETSSNVYFLKDVFCIEDKVIYKDMEGTVYGYDGPYFMVDIDHNAVACKANELELVGRKRLI